MHKSLKTNINSLATLRSVDEGFSGVHTTRFLQEGNQHESNLNMSEPLQTFALDHKDYIIAQNVEQIECVHCYKWKKWAQTQQKLLFKLQEQLMIKQELFAKTLRKLEQKIYQDKVVAQQNQKIIQRASLKIQQLELQKISIQQEKQLFQQKLQHSTKGKQMFTTPFRGQMKERQNQQDQIRQWNHLIVSENIEKNGRTCTTATRANLENSAFNLSNDRAIEKSQTKPKISQLQRIIFENTTLKQYNTVLLGKIKQLKYRRGV